MLSGLQTKKCSRSHFRNDLWGGRVQLLARIVIRFPGTNVYQTREVGPDVMQSGFGVNFLFWSGEF